MTRATATLFTNLDFVIVRDLRIHVHALLLQTAPWFVANSGRTDPPRHQLVGYVYDTSIPTFEVDLPSGAYTVSPALPAERLDLTVFAPAAELRIADHPDVYQLIVHDPRHGVHVEEIDAEIFDMTSRLRDRMRAKIWKFVQSTSLPEIVWRAR